VRKKIRLYGIGCFGLFFTLGSFTALAALKDSAPIKIRSKILNEERTLLINLPPSYQKSQTKYPVLYLLDGEWSSEKFKDVVDSLNKEGKIPELIIASIENISRQTRLRDFTPTAVTQHPGSGGADKFLKFMKEEFIPYIDDNYRTSSVRLLYGHSLAGLMSAYALFTIPDSLTGCIASSPSFSWDDELMVRSAEKFLKSHSFENKFLYIAIGTKDFPTYLKAIDNFLQHLKEKAPSGLTWKHKLYENEDHETMPDRSFPDGLILFFSLIFRVFVFQS